VSARTCAKLRRVQRDVSLFNMHVFWAVPAWALTHADAKSVEFAHSLSVDAKFGAGPVNNPPAAVVY
jgi:hypothetical protein